MQLDDNGVRHLTAGEANELAQDLGGGPSPATYLDGGDGAATPMESNNTQGGGSSPVAARDTGEDPLEAEVQERQNRVFPPDATDPVAIGGGTEDEQALSEEYRHG